MNSPPFIYASGFQANQHVNASVMLETSQMDRSFLSGFSMLLDESLPDGMWILSVTPVPHLHRTP